MYFSWGAIKIRQQNCAHVCSSQRFTHNWSCRRCCAAVAAAAAELWLCLIYSCSRAHTHTPTHMQRLFTLTTANCLPSAVSFSFSFLPTARSVADTTALSLARKLSLGDYKCSALPRSFVFIAEPTRTRRRRLCFGLSHEARQRQRRWVLFLIRCCLRDRVTNRSRTKLALHWNVARALVKSAAVGAGTGAAVVVVVVVVAF